MSRRRAATNGKAYRRWLICGSCLLALSACDGGSADDAASGSSTGRDVASSTSETTDPDTSSGPPTDTTLPPGTTAPDPGNTTTADDDDDSGSTTDAPTGMPVIVSLAHGGQTARSCDGGQTWGGFHEFGIQDDHSDYAAFGGLTFGNGAFVAATGWGAAAHILRSTDGVTWEDLPDDAFVTPEGVERPNNGASGVEFTGDGFVLFAGSYLWRSDDGLVWTAETSPTLAYSGHFREVEYLPGPGLLLIATEDYDVQGSWTIQVSEDSGATWHLGTGVTAGCGGYVQHVGGFAASDGRLLLGGGSGPTCVSDDGGLTWVDAGNLGSEIADVASYDGGFVVLAQSGEVFTSADGGAWAPLGNSGLDGGRLAWDPELGFVGEGAGMFAHSADGMTWSAATPQSPEGYVHVREFAIGRLDACD